MVVDLMVLVNKDPVIQLMFTLSLKELVMLKTLNVQIAHIAQLGI